MASHARAAHVCPRPADSLCSVAGEARGANSTARYGLIENCFQESLEHIINNLFRSYHDVDRHHHFSVLPSKKDMPFALCFALRFAFCLLPFVIINRSIFPRTWIKS